MSVRAMAWAWSVVDRIPTANATLVILKMADMAHDNGKLWPSHAYLAKSVHLSTRTVRSAVELLETIGLLRTEPRPGKSDVIWLAVTAQITFEEMPEDGEFEGGSGRGRPRKTPANRAENPDKTPAAGADESIEPEDRTDGVLAARDPFEVWWEAYPRKAAKKEAQKAWAQMTAEISKLTLEVLMERTRSFAESVLHKDPEHIAHGATWLRGERWNDALPTRRSQTDGTTIPDRGIDRAAAGQQAMVGGVGLALAEGRRRWF